MLLMDCVPSNAGTPFTPNRDFLSLVFVPQLVNDIINSLMIWLQCTELRVLAFMSWSVIVGIPN